MNVNINLFEALTDIGVKPEKAHAVEKQFEAAIDQSSKQHVEVRLGQVATKADLAELETRLHKLIIDNNYKLIGLFVGLNGAMMYAFKLFGK
jgi:hypothetical protein